VFRSTGQSCLRIDERIRDDAPRNLKKTGSDHRREPSVPFDRRVWRESRSLREHGYEVTVLCPRRKGSAKDSKSSTEIRITGIHHLQREALDGYLWEYGCALFWEFLYTLWIFLRHELTSFKVCNPPDDIVLVALPFKLFGSEVHFRPSRCESGTVHFKIREARSPLQDRGGARKT